MSDAKPRRRRHAPAGGHGGGHHGGAWKVAYADFATAMMAFFLLLWILNSASKEKKEAVANFFRSDGPFRIQSVSVGGGVVQGGAGVMNDVSKLAVKQIDRALEKARRELQKKLEESPELKDLKGQVTLKLGPEGLVIDIHEEAQHELFAVGSARPSPSFEQLLELIATTLGPLANPIQIEGHTDARPYVTATGYSNWELSSDRANASRRFLEGHGVQAARFASVVGRADRQLAAPGDPWATVNRRITVTLLRTPDDEGDGSGPAAESGDSAARGAVETRAASGDVTAGAAHNPAIVSAEMHPPIGPAPGELKGMPLPFGDALHDRNPSG